MSAGFLNQPRFVIKNILNGEFNGIERSAALKKWIVGRHRPPRSRAVERVYLPLIHRRLADLSCGAILPLNMPGPATRRRYRMTRAERSCWGEPNKCSENLRGSCEQCQRALRLADCCLVREIETPEMAGRMGVSEDTPSAMAFYRKTMILYENSHHLGL
ncbi:unnamed protein product [Nesidiocoris tenuis]|uniref:Uncharacterized protein n=1 Tax=Nesidiocoris tenuis TaxID=355587 RepID=A0A6H5GGD3_9HEMI|nr:unnamed protein product [Nesidiocoris tenuis]